MIFDKSQLTSLAAGRSRETETRVAQWHRPHYGGYQVPVLSYVALADSIM